MNPRDFVSQLESIMRAEELRFDATPGFGDFNWALAHSVSHPAKMNTTLTKFLIEKFTEKGDVVLDPMAGSGQTGVIASLRGRNAVCVDLEDKFFKWMERAKRKVERQGTLRPKGWMRNVCGDARQLSQLLGEADVVVTSPPYAAMRSRTTNEENLTYTTKRDGRNIGTIMKCGAGDAKTYGCVDAVVTSPPYAESLEGTSRHTKGGIPARDPKLGQSGTYGTPSKDNIGNLNYEVDAVITSPPYAQSIHGTGQSREKVIEILRKKGYDEKWIQAHYSSPYTIVKIIEETGYSDDPSNIGNLKHGKIDVVVTSPPFADSFKHNRQDREKRLRKLIEVEKKAVKKGQKWAMSSREVLEKKLAQQDDGYGTSKENIGNLAFRADAVITSPPYHDNKSDWDRKSRASREGESVAYSDEVGKDRRNIGNIHYFDDGEPLSKKYSKSREGKETYLEAMLTVYREMWKVLKPQGRAIVVVKPFIRNKRVVDLPYHTWLLLKKAGFQLVKLFKLRLKMQSFWRVIYYRRCDHIKSRDKDGDVGCKIFGKCVVKDFAKMPTRQSLEKLCSHYTPLSKIVPKIKHEYILVTEKET